MTDAEIATLGKLADMCRSKGVRILDLPGNVRMELDAPQAAPDKPAPSNEPDMCRCGHAEYAHMGGGCTMGCESEKCEELKAE